MGQKDIITVIDIGTSKICAAIVHITENEPVILSHGEREVTDNAVVKGEIVDMLYVSDNIVFTLIAELEDKADVRIEDSIFFLSVTGRHIKNQYGRGYSVIKNTSRTVSKDNIQEAMGIACTVPLMPEFTVLNSIDSYYLIDGKRRVPNAIGHPAQQLEAYAHIIYGDTNRINSYKETVINIGMESEIVTLFSGVASAFGCLSEEEQLKGVLMINIGAGTTEYILVCDSGVTASGVIAVGSNHIINDLALGLDIHLDIASELLQSNHVSTLKKERKAYIALNKMTKRSTRKIPIESYDTIVDLRLRELFKTLYTRLAAPGLISTINAGIVLTGGASLIPEVKRAVNSVFTMPVRVGYSVNVSEEHPLHSPQYTTLMGLITFGASQYAMRVVKPDNTFGENLLDKVSAIPVAIIKQIFKLIKSVRW